MFKGTKPKTSYQKIRDTLYPSMGIQRSVKYNAKRVQRFNANPYAIACGFAWGVAISFTPLIGFHFCTAVLFIYIMRGSYLAGWIGCIVGNPLTFPFIWVLTYKTGFLFYEGTSLDIQTLLSIVKNGIFSLFEYIYIYLATFESAHTLVPAIKELKLVFIPMLLGSVFWGAIAWGVSYAIIYKLVAKYQVSRGEKQAKRHPVHTSEVHKP